jgi:hypothetical protein
MVIVKEQLLKPDGLGRSFDPDDGRWHLLVKPLHFAVVVVQGLDFEFPRRGVTPTNRLLMGMKVNANV